MNQIFGKYLLKMTLDVDCNLIFYDLAASGH